MNTTQNTIWVDGVAIICLKRDHSIKGGRLTSFIETKHTANTAWTVLSRDMALWRNFEAHVIESCKAVSSETVRP